MTNNHKRPPAVFFGRDPAMVFFLALLVLVTIFVPMLPLSRPVRLGVDLILVVTLISGAIETIRNRTFMYLVITLTVAALAVDVIGEFGPSLNYFGTQTALKLACMSILVFMTLKQTFRPGPVTVHRIMGGIAGYLLIGITWTFAYQLVLVQAPGAIHFGSSLAEIPARQSNQLIYFSFATLTTTGYGDAYPVHPAARSLAIAEALIGQLYLAILIGSLVGMALQGRSARADPETREAILDLPAPGSIPVNVGSPNTLPRSGR